MSATDRFDNDKNTNNNQIPADTSAGLSLLA